MIREDIIQKMRNIYYDMSDGEKAVALILAQATVPVSQTQIALSAPFLGAHPQFEGRRTETTLRCVRQLIHDLRLKGIAIVSDRRGYWIPHTLEEAESFLDSMERTARSAAKSYMVTANTMINSVRGLRQREGLFDA